jgi:spore maturation protein CgeB
MFRPLSTDKEGDLVWIGNWGDDERTSELQEFLIEPVRDLGLRARIHGVRYPGEAVRSLRHSAIEYAGWVPNFDVPRIFSQYRLTVHVPRRPYAQALRGVPTIRVFEALACAVPLISAPWDDRENLFAPGADFLFASSGYEMRAALRTLLNDADAAAEIGAHGRATIEARHTCGHRVDELLAIAKEVHGSSLIGTAA